MLDLVEADRSVADVARDLEISDQSIYTWRRQDRIDRGLVPGLSSGERAELAKAKLRIAELETELRAMRQGPGPRLVRIGIEWFLVVRLQDVFALPAHRPAAQPPEERQMIMEVDHYLWTCSRGACWQPRQSYTS